MDFEKVDRGLNDPERTAAAAAALCLALPPEVKGLTEALAREVGVPYAAVTVLDAREQTVLAQSIEGPGGSCSREDSHCQYVVGLGEPVAINNTQDHSMWKRLHRNLIHGKPLQAYLGVPLIGKWHGKEQVLGAVCVVDIKARRWTAEDHLAVTLTAWKVAAIMEEQGL